MAAKRKRERSEKKESVTWYGATCNFQLALYNNSSNGNNGNNKKFYYNEPSSIGSIMWFSTSPERG